MKKTLDTIERLSIKRGYDTDERIKSLLRQQRDGYEEIIDFYRTRRYGYLDRQGKDWIVLVVNRDLKKLDKKLKNVPQEARDFIKKMIRGNLSEKDGYNELKKLEKTGVFRIVTFDLTSSEGSKRHKEERNRRKGREKAEPILVVEPGERREVSLQKLRKIEGIT